MLPEPLRQGFDISNQTPPDSLQNPATRPHQKSVHFKRNIPLPVVRSGLSPLYFYGYFMIPKQCRKDVSRSPRSPNATKNAIASQALVAQDMGPSWRLQDGRGWLKYQPIKMPILGWFMALGLPHDIEYQSLGLPIDPETWSYRKWTKLRWTKNMGSWDSHAASTSHLSGSLLLIPQWSAGSQCPDSSNHGQESDGVPWHGQIGWSVLVRFPLISWPPDLKGSLRPRK